MKRHPLLATIPSPIDPPDHPAIATGTLVEFVEVVEVASHRAEDYQQLSLRFPRLGFAYVVRSQFYRGRIDIEEPLVLT